MSFKCDCGLEFDFPVPLEQRLQEENAWLPELFPHRSLDYLHRSTKSCPSPDQPGHGSCAHTVVPMFVTDPSLCKLISDACAAFNFNPLPILHK